VTVPFSERPEGVALVLPFVRFLLAAVNAPEDLLGG
jgi:hypothetical protein